MAANRSHVSLASRERGNRARFGAWPIAFPCTRDERRSRRRLASIGLAALLSLAAPRIAHAAGNEPEAPAPADLPPHVARATEHFQKGAALFEERKFALALQEFRASYATVASPNSRLYIARCLAALGDVRDAYVEFDLVIDEAEARIPAEPRYVPTRDTAVLERDELAPSLGLVTVHVKGIGAEAKLTIGDIEVPFARWGKPFPVVPHKSVTVLLRPPSGLPLQQVVTIGAGEKQSVTFDTSPPPDAADAGSSDRRWLRPFAFAAAGIGVAGLATFAVAGAMTNATYGDLRDTCGGPCPVDRTEDIEAGRTQQTVANVGLAMGLVGAAAGATLFILSETGGPSSSPRATGLAIGFGFASIRGRF